MIFCLRFLFGGCYVWCCLLAVVFFARFSLPTPTLWVFSLAFHVLRPHYGFSRLLFCSLAQFSLCNTSISFRGGFSRSLFTPYATLWVFSPAFHPLRPRYGFSRLLFCSLAQFPLRDISISFRGGFSRSLFTPFAHAMGFPAYFSAHTPSFLFATYR